MEDSNICTNTIFDEILSTSSKLLKKFNFSNDLYIETKKSCDNAHDPSLFEIASILINNFNQTDLKTDYTKTYSAQIVYEMLINIYWYLHISSAANESLTDISIAKMYAAQKSSDTKPQSYSQKLSTFKETLAQEYRILNTPGYYQHYAKRNYFKYHSVLKQIKHSINHADGIYGGDYYYYMHTHSSMPYAIKKLESGVLFKNFRDTIAEYTSLHQSDAEDSLRSELSAFVLEKTYSGISFQRCMYAFLSSTTIDDINSLSPWSIFCFCQLFNTTRPSLCDYMAKTLENCSAIFFDPNQGHTMRHDVYMLFQIHESFLLPMLAHLLALLIYEHCKKDIDTLTSTLKFELSCYLSSKDNQASIYSYRKELLYAEEDLLSLKHTFKESSSSIDKTKAKFLHCGSKNDKTDYQFNILFCRSFFYYDWANDFYFLLEEPTDHKKIFPRTDANPSVLSEKDSSTNVPEATIGELIPITFEGVLKYLEDNYTFKLYCNFL